ncbi:hypothetical protein WMELPLUS_01323 [Wolbachia endosymbiont of Drosophila melanogaster]|nr:hypothetical protein FRT62_06265 [Wolbachia pipientis]TLW85433.1 hypothetical protein FFT12_03375 [Wolbachia endosymbiont of Drosophila teissieri]TLW85589.1 hypothetical protein FFT11_06110 [Wolbachia endosymbiont of Drosophila yakuba]CAI5594902.1 hypothetical protein WMELPLUS_01323 [Wolbachia endosymbiont of Drosophila melanogaster]QED00530.1 hypothetical protein FRT63_06275 [Wolbachia pipientis]
MQNFLDKPRQPPYHDTEGIQLSSSVQIKQQENNVVGVLFLIFCTMCTLCLHNISGFYLYKLKRAYKSFKTV